MSSIIEAGPQSTRGCYCDIHSGLPTLHRLHGLAKVLALSARVKVPLEFDTEKAGNKVISLKGRKRVQEIKNENEIKE